MAAEQNNCHNAIVAFLFGIEKKIYLGTMNDWGVLFLVYAVVFISSPLIAIIHELGHAFAYLVFTKPENIDIYIGTYGNSKNNIKFRAGKLQFYLKKSFPLVK